MNTNPSQVFDIKQVSPEPTQDLEKTDKHWQLSRAEAIEVRKLAAEQFGKTERLQELKQHLDKVFCIDSTLWKFILRVDGGRYYVDEVCAGSCKKCHYDKFSVVDKNEAHRKHGVDPDKTFKSFDVTDKNAVDIKRKCGQYCAEFGHARNHGLYIFATGGRDENGNGCGKTHIASAVYWQLVRRQFKPKFIDIYALIGLFDDKYHNNNEIAYNARKKLECLMDCDVMILDDFGAEESKVTEYRKLEMSKIIHHRHAYGLPMIFTSNNDIGFVADKYGKRVWERLRECCEIVDMSKIKGRRKDFR